MGRLLMIYLTVILAAWVEAIEETSTILTPATSTIDNKTTEKIGSAMSAQDSKTVDVFDKAVDEIAPALKPPKEIKPTEKPGAGHFSDHARPSQDARPLYKADDRVRVAAPEIPLPQVHGTEAPTDAVPPAIWIQQFAHDNFPVHVTVKRKSSNSSLTSNYSLSQSMTTAPAKNIQNILDDEISTKVSPETLEESKRDIQNVANILMSTTKQVLSNKKDRQPKPKCPTLAEVISGTRRLWNGIKTSDGLQGSLYTLFSAMSESVAALAHCGLGLLSELGALLNQTKNKDNRLSGKQEDKIVASTDPGNKIIGKLPVRQHSFPNSEPDTGLLLNGFGETTPLATVNIKSNISKTEVLDISLNNRKNGNMNHSQMIVAKTNFTKTLVLDSSLPTPVNMENNISNMRIADINQSRPENVSTNNRTQSPNFLTVNLFTINKVQGQNNYSSVLTHVDKIETENADEINDYEYSDYSTEIGGKPEDTMKKKRNGKSKRRWKKRNSKSNPDKEQKKP